MFYAIEKINGEKYPSCLKKILIASGFNTIASLRCLNEQTINNIEEFMKDNRNLIDQLNCCNNEQYKMQHEFRLLPGHRAIIMNMPEQLKGFTEKNNDTVKPKRKRTVQEKGLITDDDMKKNLVDKLINYFRKQQIPTDILSDVNIMNFHRVENANEAKCEFSCSFCEKLIPVRYRQFWMSSNLTNHFKAHAEKDRQINAEHKR